MLPTAFGTVLGRRRIRIELSIVVSLSLAGGEKEMGVWLGRVGLGTCARVRVHVRTLARVRARARERHPGGTVPGCPSAVPGDTPEDRDLRDERSLAHRGELAALMLALLALFDTRFLAA